MNILPIQTQRLSLLVVTPATLQAELHTPHHLAVELQHSVHRAWPPEHWEPHVLGLLLDTFHQHPERIGWNRYILRHDVGSPIVVGVVGAFQFGETPEIEVGYSVLPDHQNAGIATEALAALTDWLSKTHDTQRIIAHTFPHLGASVRVLQKCHFVLDGPGQEEGTIRYIRSR